MKPPTILLPLLSTIPFTTAHYNFPSLIYAGTTTTPWEYVRQWTGYYTYDPVVSVLTTDIRCNVNGTTVFAPGRLSVAAGANVGFSVSPNIYHPGPLLAYMAKVPSGKTAANWDGSGTVWFKIFQQGPVFGTQSLTWPSNGLLSLLYFYISSRPPLFNLFFLQIHKPLLFDKHSNDISQVPPQLTSQSPPQPLQEIISSALNTSDCMLRKASARLSFIFLVVRLLLRGAGRERQDRWLRFLGRTRRSECFL